MTIEKPQKKKKILNFELHFELHNIFLNFELRYLKTGKTQILRFWREYIFGYLNILVLVKHLTWMHF